MSILIFFYTIIKMSEPLYFIAGIGACACAAACRDDCELSTRLQAGARNEVMTVLDSPPQDRRVYPVRGAPPAPPVLVQPQVMGRGGGGRKNTKKRRLTKKHR